MRVIYDYQTFEEQRFGGISRYFYELCRHAESSGFTAQLAAAYCRNAYLLDDATWGGNVRPWIETPPSRQPVRVKQIRRRLGIFTRKERQRKANRDAALTSLAQHGDAIFHPTYYDPYFLKALKGRPFVLTVFDMIHERFPEFFELTDRVSTRKQQLCQAASRVIAISEQTKHDLMTIFSLEPEKIEVVYLANSLVPSPTMSAVELPESYLLYTGSRDVYKNFYFLLRALADILRKHGLKLVCTGKDFSPEEGRFCELLGLQNHVMHIVADDVLLASLYQHARAFVFPSLYEGFGIPVLEAFACGCPVILSNTSSLPEVAGDAAVYFEPKDLRSIQEAVLRVISHEHVRADLIARGYERLKVFSWETTARKTFDVYNQVFNSSRQEGSP